MFFSREEIDRLIKEDVPYFDLTCHTLAIDQQRATIAYITRNEGVVAGTEAVKAVFSALDITCEGFLPSGSKVAPGAILIQGKGVAGQIHMAWKVGQNILEHCSGVASKTARVVALAKKGNPAISILTTRKGFPGTKTLAISSILAGGAVPHRLGTSETILIFQQHMEFMGGLRGLIQAMPQIKKNSCEKKVIVEAVSLEDAKALCEAKVDGIQFDKLSPADLKSCVATLKELYPHTIFLAAGGINESNVEDYAKSGVDGIVTTSLYSAPPMDVRVEIKEIKE